MDKKDNIKNLIAECQKQSDQLDIDHKTKQLTQQIDETNTDHFIDINQFKKSLETKENTLELETAIDVNKKDQAKTIDNITLTTLDAITLDDQNVNMDLEDLTIDDLIQTQPPLNNDDNLHLEIINDTSVNESNDKIIIEFDDVCVRYDKEERLFENLNLKIYEGEFLYLVGPSGSGKSTLSRLIYRDVKNIGGTVYVDGINATKLKPRELHKLRKKIGVIFQDYKLLPNLTIYENVKYTLDVIGYPKKQKYDQVIKTLDKVGIREQKDKYPHQLSGGQQQRAAIARAIVNEPKIIVADEPTGNLDPDNALIIMDILEKINNSGTTVIMATHDTKIVNQYKHRTMKIESGAITSENKTGGYIYE